MTNEEAIQLLSVICTDTIYQSHQTSDEDEYKEIRRFVKALDKGIEALENADKYRWHDLRKNPEDLPVIGSEVVVEPKDTLNCLYETKHTVCRYGCYYGRYMFEGDEYGFDINDIVRWKYFDDEVEE